MYHVSTRPYTQRVLISVYSVQQHMIILIVSGIQRLGLYDTCCVPQYSSTMMLLSDLT